ncbi:hypothetical protein A8L58_16000 [Acidipropionibacterium acidipropionici]|nr:hypothetical protein A8L58_16000 [Acidipropionibacterium acidipropionici]
MRSCNPWQYLKSRPDITVVWAGLLPGRARGLTDGHSTIWIRTGLTQRERRCTLAHELVHIAHHHVGHQTPAVEAQVRVETARAMLPDLAPIIDGLRWGHSWWEIADDLWVTEDVLACRLDHLTPTERRTIEEAAPFAPQL